MKTYNIHTHHKKLLADTITPVAVFLRLRDQFPNSFLLESSDYHSKENNVSYICCQPLAEIKVTNGLLTGHYPDNAPIVPSTKASVLDNIQSFIRQFKMADTNQKYAHSGFFGYANFEAVQYFEDVTCTTPRPANKSIPEIQYHFFQYVIAIDHFNDELHLFEHVPTDTTESTLDYLEQQVFNISFPQYPFELEGKELSNLKDEDFIDLVRKGKKHCYRGDVFQIVLSRAFQQGFSGDEFQVYRALRTINPSPYLYYFDYGSFKIFGSSPEAQLTISKEIAAIHPIAGTYRRTGNDLKDLALAQKLQEDPKENAEHVMLVDLARNDLSKSAQNIKVDSFREVQYFSHVIHLVSKVTGHLPNYDEAYQLFADTFPAGTLSGAPKHKALTLINEYENQSREFYGGAIGFLGLNGRFNHAIIIRSFLSKNNQLHYQAGAGIVASSDEQSELQEVNNKLAALKKALTLASSI